ncbi:telomere repeat-binding factor 4-like protein [Tanacetum coccineum]
MASKDNTFRSEASSRTVPELLSELTETWKKHEEDLLKKAKDLEYKLKKKNEDYEVLIHSDSRHKEELKVLKKKIEGLEDEVKRKVNNIGEMKMMNDQCIKKISVYRNIFPDLDVKVLCLEKLGNELMGSGCSYKEMIVEALASTEDPNGNELNVDAIYYSIEQKYELPGNFRRLVTSKLRRLVLSKVLEKAGDYYKFNKEDAEPVSADTEPVSAETEEKIASTAANLCLDLITS